MCGRVITNESYTIVVEGLVGEYTFKTCTEECGKGIKHRWETAVKDKMEKRARP